MAANATPIFVGSISGKLTEFTNANGVTEADVFAGDASEATRIDTLSVSTDDTAAGVIYFFLSDGTNDKKVAAISVAASSGTLNTGATPPVDVMRHANFKPLLVADAAGNYFMDIPAGWKLRAAMNAAPTSGKFFWVAAKGGKY